jgi:hypothetical protein
MYDVRCTYPPTIIGCAAGGDLQMLCSYSREEDKTAVFLRRTSSIIEHYIHFCFDFMRTSIPERVDRGHDQEKGGGEEPPSKFDITRHPQERDDGDN